MKKGNQISEPLISMPLGISIDWKDILNNFTKGRNHTSTQIDIWHHSVSYVYNLKQKVGLIQNVSKWTLMIVILIVENVGFLWKIKMYLMQKIQL